MKSLILPILTSLLLISFPAAADEGQTGYRLGAGDALGAAIYDHYDHLASKDATLRDAMTGTQTVQPGTFRYAVRIGPWTLHLTGRLDTAVGRVEFDFSARDAGDAA